MKLDLGSFMFNVNVNNGGTPSWGTALGQNLQYKFDLKKIDSDFFSALLFNGANNNLVDVELGKGGKSENYEILLSSLFEKIYVNNVLIENAKFLLLIVKEKTLSHTGRKSLKYVPSAKYDGKNYNFDCLNLIKNKFNLTEDSAWIITNIDFKNQDELHFKLYTLNNEHILFENAVDRKKWINDTIEKIDEPQFKNKFDFLIDDYKIISEKLKNADTSLECFSIKNSEELDSKTIDKFITCFSLNSKEKNIINESLNIAKYLKDKSIINNHLNKNAISYKFDNLNKSGINLIVYGTPGCGKSYYVKNELLPKYGSDLNGIPSIRTTFYQDYTNTDFVGQIMPVVKTDGSVTYEFNPGPFSLALNQAIQNPDKPVALVIEELNRGNAASIFGDIFQLLDRENGLSVYNITNVNVQKYLAKENSDYKFDYIKLPSNLSIICTMNTSDQNVFTLDTAFKRRWKFEKIKNTFDSKHEFKDYFIPGMDVDWEDFCKSINQFILESKDDITNSEDKQIGVYFVSKDGLRVDKSNLSNETQRKEFAFKIFEYLWDDVAKYSHDSLFKDAKSLDDLIEKYVSLGSNDIDGIKVFNDNIIKKSGN